MIISQFSKAFNTQTDFQEGQIDSVLILNDGIKLEGLKGTWQTTITTENLTKISGGKIFWDYNIPPNTSMSVEVSDGINWIEIENNGTIPYLETQFDIRVTLETTDTFVSPELNSLYVNVWEEAKKSPFIKIEVPQLYDLKGEMVAYLENITDFLIDTVHQEKSVMFFSIPATDLKVVLIGHDQEIVYKNKRYIITGIDDGKDDNGLSIVEVTCELAYVELLNKTHFGEFLLDRVTMKDGLSKILSGTNWTIGIVEDDTNNIYSLKETNKTALYCVRAWAEFGLKEIQWDTMNKKINLLNKVGSSRGGFRFGKNLKSVKRKMKPPVATVVYPYGSNGLTISDINGGNEFIEDYSWYVEQGLTLTDARKKYKKEMIWEDDRFILAGSLMQSAQAKLANLARPQISYECSVFSLSAMTGEEEVYSGDYVPVYDKDLGIDISARILQKKEYPFEPWKDELTLDYMTEGIHTYQEQSISSDVQNSQPSVIFGSNSASISIGNVQTYPMSLSMSTFTSVNAQVGLMIIGQASQDLTISVQLMLNGTAFGPQIKQKCLTGFNTIGVPFLMIQVPSGSSLVDVQVQTDVGTFTVGPNDFQVYIYSANLLGGLTAKLPRAMWEEEVVFELLQVGDNTPIPLVMIPIDISVIENVSIEQLTISDEMAVQIV